MSTEEQENKPYQIRDRRGGNRYYVDNVFLRGGWAARVGVYALAVYNVLAMFADGDEQAAWPSYQTMADLTGMSRRHAMRAIAETGTTQHNHQSTPTATDQSAGVAAPRPLANAQGWW